MTIKTRIVALTSLASVIASSTVAANDTAAMSLAGAQLYDTVPITIWNPSTQNVYLGGSSMTTASSLIGMPFGGPGYFTYNLIASDPLFGITTAGEVDVTVQAGRQS